MSNFDENKFKEDLSILDLNHFENTNTKEMSKIFHSHFMKTLNKPAPIKVLSKKKAKTKQKPWLTTKILKLISHC